MDSRQVHDSKQIPPSETAQPSQISAETDPMERFLDDSPCEPALLPKPEIPILDSSESFEPPASFPHRTSMPISWQESAETEPMERFLNQSPRKPLAWPALPEPESPILDSSDPAGSFPHIPHRTSRSFSRHIPHRTSRSSSREIPIFDSSDPAASFPHIPHITSRSFSRHIPRPFSRQILRLDSSESYRHPAASFPHRTSMPISWQEPASRSAVSVEQKSTQGFSQSLLDEDESMSDSSSNPKPASRSAVSVEQKSTQGLSPSLLDEDESMSDSSSNPDDNLDEFIVNPRRYHDRLAALRKKTTLNSFLFTIMEGKSSTRDVEAALNAPGMDSSSFFVPSDVEEAAGLKTCSRVLQKICESIDRMKTCGFCTGFINVLVLHFDRYDVVYLNPLDTKVIQDLFDLSCNFLKVETKPFVDIKKRNLELSDIKLKIMDRTANISKALGLKEAPFQGKRQEDWIPIMVSMAKLIDLIVLLYCSAHLERFDQRYLQISLESLRMDFFVAEVDHILFKRRTLACLNKYLGNQQVWVLQLEKTIQDEINPKIMHPEKSLPLPSDPSVDENTQLSVSAHIEDLADIWGPLWPVKIESLAGIAAFQAGAGVLVPWPKDTAASENGEIYYHWTEDLDELPLRLGGFSPPTFSEKKRLLVGGQARLEVKQSCDLSARKVTQKFKDANCLRMQGTKRSRIYQDSETFSGTIGYIASLTAAMTLKRSDCVSVKDYIIPTWMPDNPNRNPKILECWYGIEVSACSGNARRRRLKDIFNLPAMRKHLDMCYSGWADTDYGNGFSQALDDQDKRAFQKLWKHHPEWQSELQKLVYTCFDALRHTEVDGNDQLSVFWMSDNDQQVLVHIPAGLSSWTGILKDTECSCAMAVLSTSCLGISPSYSQSIRASDCRKGRASGFTLIETALVINGKAKLPKTLTYSKNCKCGSKRCWDTRKLGKGDNLSLGQLGNIILRDSQSNHAQILVHWEKGIGTEIREAREEANANILKGSPMRHHREVMESSDERRRTRPVRLFLMSHTKKKPGEWEAY